jgi:hypothetical protein
LENIFEKSLLLKEEISGNIDIVVNVIKLMEDILEINSLEMMEEENEDNVNYEEDAKNHDDSYN